MTGKELKELCEQYPDFVFEFVFTDGYSKFPNVRTFKNLELADVGHSSCIVLLSGEE